MVLWLELPGGSRLLPGFVRREALTCPPPSLGCAPPGSGRSSLACVMLSGPALRPCSQAMLSGPGSQAHALRPCSHRWSCMDGAARACTIPYALAHAPHLPNAPVPTPHASTPPASTPPASTPPASTSLLPAPSHPMACFYPIPMLGLLQCRACRHAPCHAWLGSKHEPTHSQTPHPRGTTPRSTGKGQGPALWPKSGP